METTSLASSVPRCVASSLMLQSDFPESDKTLLANAIKVGDDKLYIEGLDRLRCTVGDLGFTRRNLVALDILSKADFLALGIDRKREATKKFVASEVRCAATNSRLSRHGRGDRLLGRPAGDVLFSLRSIISDCLGEWNADELPAACGFGPGSNVGNPRRQSLPHQKIGNLNPTVTKGALNLATAMLQWYDLWGSFLRECGGNPRIVPGNKVTSVPKSYKTERTIAVEPLLNCFLQKGVGRMIRRRLRRRGLDLNRAPSLHHYLACFGSVSGEYATIDLASASDTLACETVGALLPPDWFEVLDQVRSPRGALASDGIICYEKFSSMGNGYTFELESLIFWAACRYVCSEYCRGGYRSYSVFGDDIIVPEGAVEPLVELLCYLGFETNGDKSFSGGHPFRESCGMAFLNGFDVTPFYIRKDVHSPERLLWLANSIKRWSSRVLRDDSWGLDINYREVYSSVVQRIPRHFLTPIPNGVGDGGIVVDVDEARPTRSRKGLEGWVYSPFRRFYKTGQGGGVPMLVASLLAKAQLERDEEDEQVPASLDGLREYEVGSVSDGVLSKFPEASRRYVFKRSNKPLITPHWPTLGPWI